MPMTPEVKKRMYVNRISSLLGLKHLWFYDKSELTGMYGNVVKTGSLNGHSIRVLHLLEDKYRKQKAMNARRKRMEQKAAKERAAELPENPGQNQELIAI